MALETDLIKSCSLFSSIAEAPEVDKDHRHHKVKIDAA